MPLAIAFTTPTVAPSPVVAPDDVGGPVAFDTLLRDGELLLVHGRRAVPRGTPITPRVRVLALAPEVPPRTVIGRASACWVFLGGMPPGRLTVLYPPSCHRPHPGPTLASHQAALGEDETVRLGSIAVTTPARTAADLALFATGPDATRLVGSLVSAGVTSVREVLVALGRRSGDAAYGRALDVVRALA